MRHRKANVPLLHTFDDVERSLTMTKLFDGVSRGPGRVRPRALLMLTAVALVVLATLWPATGDARRGCGDNLIFYSSVVTDLPSVDCDTAMTKAYRKALQGVENQRAAYVCPQACLVLVLVTAPHVISYACYAFQTPFGTRYDGVADAQGTYKCVVQQQP
jgi:hypothetical protein